MRVFPCRYCNAPIMLLKTCKGKIKVDVEQHLYQVDTKAKNVVYTPNGECYNARYSGLLDKPTGIGYVPHVCREVKV